MFFPLIFLFQLTMLFYAVIYQNMMGFFILPIPDSVTASKFEKPAKEDRTPNGDRF